MKRSIRLGNVWVFVSLLFLSSPALAGAETIVGAGGKPGVAMSWTSKGDTTTLSIKDGFSAEEVAEAIQRGVPGAKARGKGDKVTVSGLAQDKLLVALERVEVDQALDDVDAALANMQNLPTAQDEGSGSSIRATKATDLSAVTPQAKNEEAAAPKDEPTAVTGTVLKVVHKKFPLVVLSVQVDTADKTLKPGENIEVLPHLVMKEGKVDRTDPTTKKNLNAWYARVQDKVRLKIQRAKDGTKFWIATDFDRASPPHK